MAQPEFKLGSELKVGPVCLRTKNLDTMLCFYERDFGLNVVQSDEGYTALAAGSTAEPVIILHHEEKASNPPPNATGLYHYALLVPDRKSLAAAYLTLGNKGIVFDGYADHQVSEALYLSDPEGNGIEIYRDRPRSEWKFDEGGVDMATQPLDLDSLIKELPFEPEGQSKAIADGTKVGHVHLKVSDLQNSLTFYRDALGFELMRYWGSAAFLSAGRYHHHIGMNTWESLGGPPARKAWTGLEYFVFTVAETDVNELSSKLAGNYAVERTSPKQLYVSDPDETSLLFRAF
jgi:catechol 2,3-dioxygenase